MAKNSSIRGYNSGWGCEMKSFPPLFWIFQAPSCLDLRGHSWLHVSECFVFISWDPLSSVLFVRLSALCPSTPVTSFSHKAFSSISMLVIPTILHLCVCLLSVSVWVSGTHLKSTHVTWQTHLFTFSPQFGFLHVSHLG